MIFLKCKTNFCNFLFKTLQLLLIAQRISLKYLEDQTKPSKTGSQISTPTTPKTKLCTQQYTITWNTDKCNTKRQKSPMPLLKPLDLFAFTRPPSPNHSPKYCKWHIFHDLLPTPNSQASQIPSSELLQYTAPCAYPYYNTCHFTFKFHLPACLPHQIANFSSTRICFNHLSTLSFWPNDTQ